MNQSNNIVETRYTQPGCIEGCKYRLPDTERYRAAYDVERGVHYTVHEVTPHCAKDKERAGFRAAIYAEAQRAVDEAGDRCTTIRGKMRAHEREWERVTKPYREGPCPFFMPEENEE